MLSRFFKWLGWESERRPAAAPARARKPRSATAHLFEKRPLPAQRKTTTTTEDGDFNPYNTGKFDRSASWERISKNQR